MFNDGRSKKVIFIAHCILNQNAISDGTAVYPAAFKAIIGALLKEDIGIFQMPCPEFSCLGLDRGNIHGADSPVTVENTRIRREMQAGAAGRKLAALADYVVQQLLDYHRHGFQIVGIIGANRSPNCGVDTTSDDNRETEGKGLFMELLSKRLAKEELTVPLIGIKSTEDFMSKINELLHAVPQQ